MDISGISSSVTRVTKTIYYSGVTMPVQHGSVLNGTMNDQLMLDGKVLIHIGTTSSYYEYRFEEDDQSIIRLTRARNADQQVITVETKSGILYTYGGNGRTLNAYNGEIAEWFLWKVEDMNNQHSFITYDYTNHLQGWYVNQIQHSHGVVKFEYRSRLDPIPILVGGMSIAKKQRLKSIEVKTTADFSGSSYEAKVYEFSYKDGGYTLLDKVEEVNRSLGTRVVLNTFQWGDYPSKGSYFSPSNTMVNNSLVSGWLEELSYISADINGDGLSDLIGLHSNNETSMTYFIARRETDNNIVFDQYHKRYKGCKNFQNAGNDYKYESGAPMVVDLYGTGEQQIVFGQRSSGSGTSNTVQFLFPISSDLAWDNAYNSGNYTIYSAPCSWGDNFIYASGDMDNDGRTELLYLNRQKNSSDKYVLTIVKANENGRDYAASVSIELSFSKDPQNVMVADFDGDGLQDILIQQEDNGFIFWNDGGAPGQYGFSDNRKFSDYSLHSKSFFFELGDFNGDGLTDIVYNIKHTNSWWLLTNKGRRIGFTSTHLPNITAVEDQDTWDNDEADKCFVVDFDGDGLSDLIISNSRYSGKNFIDHNVYWYRSTGAGFEVVKHRVYNHKHKNYRSNRYAFGDFNGDGYPEIVHYGFNALTDGDDNLAWRIYRNAEYGHNSRRITRITDGLGNRTSIQYRNLNSTLYTPASDVSSYPVMSPKAIPLYVVYYTDKAYVSENKVQMLGLTSYAYKGLKFHLQGKGFLGFERVRSYDRELKKVVDQNYEINLQFFKPSLKQIRVTVNNSLTSTLNYTNEIISLGSQRYIPYVSQSSETSHLTGVTIIKGFTYDGLGRLTSDYVDYGASDKRIENTYTYDITRPYKISLKKVRSCYGSRASNAWYEDNTHWTYHADGYVKNQTIHYGKPQAVTTELGSYDDNGLPRIKTVSAAGIPSTTESYIYNPQGRITRYSNALGQTTYRYYDVGGRLLREEDHNGNETTYGYDVLGRPVKTTSAIGTWSYDALCSIGGDRYAPEDAIYRQLRFSSDGAEGATYYDSRGQALRTVSNDAQGQIIQVDTEYDSLGQVTRQSQPYFRGDSKVWTSYGYDQYQRLLEVKHQGLTTSYNYPLGTMTTITTNPAGQVSKTTLTASGDVLETEDHLGNVVTYGYHMTGNPSWVKAAGAATIMEYDAYGRQTKLVDLSAGTIRYVYDALGRLTSQTDARGNTTILEYDVMGRMTKKSSPDGNYYYQYYNYGLEGVFYRPDNTSPWQSKNWYTYDQYGRVTQEYVRGRYFNYAYNENGQLLSKRYPNGFLQEYEYNNGELTHIFRMKGGSYEYFWSLVDKNARGQVREYNWGTESSNIAQLEYDSYGYLQYQQMDYLQQMDYQFDPRTGNLLNRTDYMTSGDQESFTYDGLNRLTSWMGGSINYGGNGNILQKSDVGEYEYGSIRPHATIGITPISGVDNQLWQPQNVTYNAKGRPAMVQQSGNQVTFEYDDEGQRTVSTLNVNGLQTVRRYYSEDYEEEVDAYGNVTSICKVYAPTGLVAMDVEKAGIQHTYYVATDHLGSIVAFAKGDDNPDFFSYDPWGRLRDPYTLQPYAQGQEPALLFGRGYTEHEHLPAFGLINMNARLYDPLLGRFLSPDPYVADGSYSQDFNRYSYARNNPLAYTDPSGEFIFSVLAAIFCPTLLPAAIGSDIGLWSGGSMANGTLNPFKWDYTSTKTWGYMAGGAFVGAVSGATGGAIATSGIPFANTAAIVGASWINSVGTYAYTGGQTDLSISFGVASYNFSRGTFGYLGKEGNKWYENVGYGMGALANLPDVISLFGGGANVSAITEKKDGISHAAVAGDGINISVGPMGGGYFNKNQSFFRKFNNLFKMVEGDGNWANHLSDGHGWKLPVNNVNKNILSKLSDNLALGKNFMGTQLQYSGVGYSCVSYASRALWAVGVPNIGLHPYLWQTSLLVRQVGIYSSPYLYQIP